MNYHDFSCYLSTLSGCELVALAGIFSVAISENLSSNDTAVLARFLHCFG